ncbi:lipopolysaccharide biosynthesis protein [Curtobacterium sp. MCPF17_001]|uniref:lipopolysaccharide biosynthesis protein n=1 Tax=Curtobacterium sp. MCPF17_001 TaxID=2175651 RepID=UPI0015E8DBCA|nr:oligosaccharide flippase family protein [Curtobacterium sp. MCPF17_001]
MPAERSGFVQRAWQSGLPRILSGSVIGQGAVLAVSPLLTRLYQPAAFGLLAVVTGVSAVVGAVATLGLERAVPLPRSGTAARVLVTSACIAVAVSGVVTTLLTFGYRRELGTALSAPALVGLWWMIPVAVVAIALQRIVAAVLTRRRDHGALGARNALQGVVQVVASVALAPAGVIGLVIAPSAGRIAASIGGLGWMRRPTFRLVSCRVGRLVLGRFRRFIWAAPLSALLNVSGQQLPTLMIASSEGVVVAGFVGLAVRVLAAPVGVLTDAVGQWFTGSFSAVLRTGRGDVLALVLRTSARTAVPAVCAAVVIAVVAPTAFVVVFGDEWLRAGEIARLLVVLFAVQLSVSPVSQALPLLERQVAQLAWDGGRFVLVVGGVALAIALDLGTLALITTYVALSVTAYAVLWVLVATAARRHDAVATHPRPRKELPCSLER